MFSNDMMQGTKVVSSSGSKEYISKTCVTILYEQKGES